LARDSGLAESPPAFLARLFNADQGPDSNQELASQIGTFRELVSRNLSRFQSEGLVKIDGRSEIIHDLKALEAERRSAE
jgi:CRP-like cAMP-binding protein